MVHEQVTTAPHASAHVVFDGGSATSIAAAATASDASSASTASSAPSAPSVSLDTWVATLRTAARASQDAARAVLREIDPGADTGRPRQFERLSVLRGQMDDDPADEAVIHVMYRLETARGYSYSPDVELHWIGVFDPLPEGQAPAGQHQLVGLFRGRIVGCNPGGVTIETAFADRALRVKVLHSLSCGDSYEVYFERHAYRLENGRLAVSQLSSEAGDCSVSDQPTCRSRTRGGRRGVDGGPPVRITAPTSAADAGVR